MRRHKKSRHKKSMAGGKQMKAPSRLHRLRLPLAVAVVVLTAAAVGGALLFTGGGSEGRPSGPKTAAIVDQLSLTEPNPEFADAAAYLLRQAGYAVDYYAGKQVTVDFYRDLPDRDYDLILLRVHAGAVWAVNSVTGEREPLDYVSLFTGEPYIEWKYHNEQEQQRVTRSFYYEGSPEVFSIEPDFVTDSMKGEFDNALIVMMGCDGLGSERMAQAFLDKGARAFVSWDDRVSAGHTDTATERLLELLLVEGLTAEAAVARTAAEVGPDPAYGAELGILTDGS